LRIAVEQALAESGLRPGDIAFVNAHGTGTLDNDRIESEFFHAFFPGVPFLSTKGCTGHTLGAAGALEAAFTLGCLKRGKIPPSGGFRTPDPALPASPVSRITTIAGNCALSETLAFGGNNAVLILGLDREGA
jgi:3-oxoacyl-(acyl-carrier-protein) synthase